MANPNSLTTAVRRWLASKIQPYPDDGEAWCVACSLNVGTTVIVPVFGLEQHLKAHGEDEHVSIVGSWPETKGWSGTHET